MMNPKLAVNCSILMQDVPLRERLAIVAEHGFRAVELWWPFADAAPSTGEVDRFASVIEESGLHLVALNLFAGDMPAGDRGIISWPGREDELEASLDVLVSLGHRLGVRMFNALYGNRLAGVAADEQDAVAVRRLARAARRLEECGGTVLLEPVSGFEGYPVKTAEDAVRILDRVAEEEGVSSLALLLDVYHLAVNGDDVDRAIDRFADRIGHVQLADAPGRGAPGTGNLPIWEWLGRVRESGYTGWVSWEYAATGPTALDAIAAGDRV